MSENKNKPAQWKSEEQRMARKARLAEMKSKDGGKKQIRTANPLTRLITIIVLVIALLVTSLWAIVRSGLPHRELAAVAIGDHTLSAVDINYYYYQQLASYGLDPTNPETKATLDAPSGMEGFKTNADFIKDQAIQQLREDVLLAEQAALKGLSLSAEESESVENYISGMAANATKEGKSLDNFLAAAYGTGMNEKVLRRCVDRMLLADLFAQDKISAFTHTDEDLQKAYDKTPEQYDLIDYRVFYHAANIKTEATEAEKTKAMEISRKAADNMLTKITDEASFRSQSVVYAADADKEAYRDDDISLNRSKYYSNISPSQVRDWLFEADRTTGDKAVIESTSGYYVVMFLNRTKGEFEQVNVRHILTVARNGTATTEQITAAKQKAEKILADYQAGEQTEEAFAELAKQNSEDGNAAQGGLYEGVYKGRMVTEFEDWCFNPARKTGDTGIVQTDFGFHVMYYVGTNGVDWKIRTRDLLNSEAYQQYLEELGTQNPYTIRSFGFRFVG